MMDRVLIAIPCLTLFAIGQQCLCLDLVDKCPHISHRHYRGRSYCEASDSAYLCLKDTNNGGYVEVCQKKPELHRKGNKVVWRENLDGEECNADNYQPITYTSNDGDQCILKKLKCNGEGQVVFDHGSSVNDSTCRCDHRKGYSFVVVPANSRYCLPSIEDCSCYQKSCPLSYILSSDYTCKKDEDEEVKRNCQSSDSDSFQNSEKVEPEKQLKTFHPKDSDPQSGKTESEEDFDLRVKLLEQRIMKLKTTKTDSEIRELEKECADLESATEYTNYKIAKKDFRVQGHRTMFVIVTFWGVFISCLLQYNEVQGGCDRGGYGQQDHSPDHNRQIEGGAMQVTMHRLSEDIYPYNTADNKFQECNSSIKFGKNSVTGRQNLKTIRENSKLL